MRFSCIALTLVVASCGRSSFSTALDGDSGPTGGDSPTGGDNPTGGDSLPPPIGTVLLGQATNTHNNIDDGMSLPIGAAVCNGRLFVVDTSNNRVIGWSTLPASGPPDFVLGQPDLSTAAVNYDGVVNARSLAFPFAIACTDQALAVADNGNSRALLWTPLPTDNFAPATVVLGQPNLVSRGVAATPSASTLSGPSGVTFSGGRLCVSDTSNHRVLCWSSLPATDGAPADIVLGQPDMTSNTPNNGGLGPNALYFPGAIAGTDSSLAICDRQNMRVLYYGAAPLAGGPNQPTHVLGQADFMSSVQITTPTESSIEAANGVSFLEGGTLVVADGGGSRIMLFGPVTQDNQAAYALVGGAPTTTNPTNWGPATLSNPSYAASNGSVVYVTDTFAARVLMFPLESLTSGASATAVLGQPLLTTGAVNAPLTGIDARIIGFARDVTVAGGTVIAVDQMFDRVLVWNAIPTSSFTPADVVLGQTDGSGFEPRDTPSATTVVAPAAAIVLGGRLLVSDGGNNRVLVFDSVPTVSGAAATYAIGQPDLTSNAVVSVVSGTTLLSPGGLATDGTRLAVADTAAYRVLLWNTLPSDSSTPADIALGQQDLTHDARPNAPSRTNLAPADVCFADGSLVVADSGQSRVLIWRTIPTSSGAAADVVLGQSAFDVTDSATTDARSVVPRSVRYNGGLLYVSTGNRILVWRGVPTVNDAPADLVIGQPTMTQDLPNGGGIGGDTLQSPGGVGFTSDGRLLIADGANGRVVIRPAP